MRVGQAALLVGLVALLPLVAAVLADRMPLEHGPAMGRPMAFVVRASWATAIVAALVGAATLTRAG